MNGHQPVQRPNHLAPVPSVATVERPDLLQTLKHWHNGHKNRISGEVQPWRVIVLTHLDSMREVDQWDLRADEDDVMLALEIEARMNAHGKPISQGSEQRYQLDCYFGHQQSPSANWTGTVMAPAAIQYFGQPAMRGPMNRPEDFLGQTYRHNEMTIQNSTAATQFAITNLTEQLRDARSEIARLNSYIKDVQDRDKELQDESHKRRLEEIKQIRSENRKDAIAAKFMNYAPVFMSAIDRRFFGRQDASSFKDEDAATKVMTMIFKKLSGEEGMTKMMKIVSELGLEEKEVSELMTLGQMLSIEQKREEMHREAEKVSKGGGFMSLGEDLEKLANPKKIQVTSTVVDVPKKEG